MLKRLLKPIVGIFTITLFISCNTSDKIKLFNGESLEGWEGSTEVFKVADQAIVGANLKEAIPQSEYLCTKKKYDNYTLELSVKFVTDDLNVNGGISFRANRVPNSNEVMGYQADVGYLPAVALPQFSNVIPADTTGLHPLWGSLVDENRFDHSRYPRPDIFPVVFLKVADKEHIEEIIDPLDWNTVNITANGPDIEIKINGVTTAKFTEDTDVTTNGQICLQAHAGGPYEVRYKDIVLKPLE